VRCKKRMMHPLHDDGDDDQLLGATEHSRSATSG
jgi:hypothetical protein